MSRIQSGALHLVCGRVGLDEVVPRALASLPDDGRSIEVDVPESLPRVDVDAALLERAIANVAGNAVRMDPAGEAGPHRSAQGVRRRVELRVVDRGPGIAPIRPRPRVRTVPAARRSLGCRRGRTRTGRGQGVRRGDGRRARDRGHAGRRPDDGRVVRGGAMTRVLVVDDEPQILRGLRTNLRARGYEVDTAADGETALDLAAGRLPDIVILDLGLPGIDGIEVIRGLRAWSAMPIIVLSAREQEPEKVGRARRRRGRLRHEAVRHGRTARPPPRRRTAERARPRGARRSRPRHSWSTWQRSGCCAPARRRASHADRMAPGRDPRPQPGQAGQPAPAAPGGVGSPVRGRDQLPPRLHGPDPAQARTRPRPPRYFITEPGMGYRFEGEHP